MACAALGSAHVQNIYPRNNLAPRSLRIQQTRNSHAVSHPVQPKIKRNQNVLFISIFRKPDSIFRRKVWSYGRSILPIRLPGKLQQFSAIDLAACTVIGTFYKTCLSTRNPRARNLLLGKKSSCILYTLNLFAGCPPCLPPSPRRQRLAYRVLASIARLMRENTAFTSGSLITPGSAFRMPMRLAGAQPDTILQRGILVHTSRLEHLFLPLYAMLPFCCLPAA
jgi:hypothetical protein